MIQDPYSVLGIPATATDAEVKQAYRTLAKKFHPDVNHGSPEAEKKMKEINEAYDMIVNHKYTPGQNAQGGAYGQGYGGSYYGQSQSYGGQYAGQGGAYEDPFEWFTGGYSSNQRRTYSGEANESADMRAVRNYINTGHYSEALNLLSQISVRGPRWCFYSAIAHEGLGNRINAVNYAQQAVRMDPTNQEYRELLQRLQYNRGATQNYGRNFNMPVGNARFCLSLCMMSILFRYFPCICCF